MTSLASRGRNRAVLPVIVALGLATGTSILSGPLASPAHAATTVVISGTAEATSTQGTSIVTGDTFDFTFTLDLDSQAASSKFNNSVTAFSLTAGAGNVGTWSPAGVNWQISPVKNVDTNEFSNQLTVQVTAPNAPNVDGLPFFDLGISLVWNSAVVDVQPTVDGNSLGTTLGTFTPDVAAASYFFELRADAGGTKPSASYVAAATSTPTNDSFSTAQVPPPVLQQFGRPASGACESNAPDSLDIGGASAGGWGESWAQWMNNGLGGPVCTRTLVYSNTHGKWVVN